MTKKRRYRSVSASSELDEVASVLEAASEHALDTEANSGFAYCERLCLFQLNVAGQLWLVDLLALTGEGKALDSIRSVLESPEHTTFVHGGEFDVGCFKRDYDLQLRGLWDSQQAASFLGWPRTGYGAVVERICGVKLPKAFAHFDWGRRPIDPEPLQYALNDVSYLLRVGQKLRQEVLEADLEEEVALANRAVEEATWNGGFSPDGFSRIKGARHLEPGSLAVLASLYTWRDDVARRQDQPPGRLLNDRVLLALSRGPASSPEDLRRAGLQGRRLSQWGSEISSRIRSARGQPPPRLDFPERRGARDPQTVARGQRLKSWRMAEAKRRSVPLQVVLPAAALRHLQRHGGDDLEAVPQLGPKRIRLYGDRLRELCESDLATRS